jgi:hypothetical protein
MASSKFQVTGVFYSSAKHPLVGQGILIFEASRLHSDTEHWEELLWESDQPDAETPDN